MNLRPSNPEEDALFDFGHDGRIEPETALETTLARVQLATGSAGAAAMPTTLRTQLWEDIMHANTAIPAGLTLTGHPTGPGRSAPASIPARTRGPALPHRPWTIALNALIAAALIVALAGGAWRIAQDRGLGLGGNNPEPSSIPYGGYIPQDGESLDLAGFPTGEDCTVEPLTVDEVMEILTDPRPSAGWYPRDASLPTPELTPDAQGYLPSQETIDAAAEAWKMWKACDMAGSLFQRWAVETPASVQSYILSRLPNLTSQDAARDILEELWETGESSILLLPDRPEQTVGTPVQNPIAATLVDPNPANSWEVSDGFLLVGVIWYDESGAPMGNRTAQESRQYAQFTNGPAGISCTVPMMGLAEDLTTWLVNESVVGCG